MINLSEKLAVVGTLDPASHAVGDRPTDVIAVSVGNRFLFTINTGVLGAAGTLDFKVQGATASGGTYVDIPGTAITQIVKATGDNKVVDVEVSGEVIADANPNYSHIRGVLVVGVAASLAGVVCRAGGLRYGPARDVDSAKVVQILAKVN